MYQILVHLYAGKNGLDGVHAYESAVLPILRSHGGGLLTAFRPKPHPTNETPDEIHLVQFESEADFQAYRIDERLTQFHALREENIAKTVLFFSAEMVSYV